MDIKKIIKEELNTVKYSDLHNWSNEKPVRTNMKVTPNELLEMLSDDYDKINDLIEKIFSAFSKKVVVKAGLLPEDEHIIYSSFVNNYEYIKNRGGEYSPSAYWNGLDNLIFDDLKTIQTSLGGVPFGDYKGVYMGNDFRDVLKDTSEAMSPDERVGDHLYDKINELSGEELLKLYLNGSPSEVIQSYLDNIKGVEDDNMGWIQWGDDNEYS